jgi:hypothetical protein
VGFGERWITSVFGLFEENLRYFPALLPLAREGLRRWGVDPGSADRLLGIIEQRCLTGRNGAVWQVATTRAISEQTGADRAEALRQMTQRYIELMHGNEPVHTWPRLA